MARFGEFGRWFAFVSSDGPVRIWYSGAKIDELMQMFRFVRLCLAATARIGLRCGWEGLVRSGLLHTNLVSRSSGDEFGLGSGSA
jgi:hypothetical protein